MSSTVSGVLWKANYGEVSDNAKFRVGKISPDTWDATFPIAQLGDLVTLLSAANALPVDVVQKTTTLQLRKVYAGFFTDVIVEPRLDTGTPAEILRFGMSELPDLLYVAQLLATDLQNKFPDDWDFSDLPIAMTFDKYGQVTNEIAQAYFEQAVSDSVSKKVGDAGVLYASKYGVKADGVTNDTVALKNALADASAKRATLVLPLNGKIILSQSIDWKYMDHDIVGQGCTLDFRALTSGVGLNLVGSTLVGRVRKTISSVFIQGPSTPGNLVDGIGHPTTSDTREVNFVNLLFSGFRHHVNIGTNAYLWTFRGCRFVSATSSSILMGGTNMGENLVFDNCLFDANTTAPYLETGTTAGLSAFFQNCSFDFGYQVANIKSGTFDFDQCHFEGQYAVPWITVQGGGSRPSVVSLRGGQFVAQGKSGDTTTNHTLVRITPPASGTDDVTVNFDRIHIKDSSGTNGVVALEDVSGVPNQILMNPVAPVGYGTGATRQRITLGTPTNLLRAGAFTSPITINTAGVSYSSDVWNGSASSVAAYSHDTSKVTKRGVADGCAKFTGLSFTARDTIMAKKFAVQGLKPVLISLQWAAQNLTTDVTGIRALATWFDAGVPTTAIGSEFDVSGLLRGGIFSTTGQTLGWELGSIIMTPPSGAGFLTIRIAATNTSADALWFSMFLANQF